MPPTDPTDAVLSAIGQTNLLDPGRLAELTTWVVQNKPDPQTLARELTRRGWLTPFQVKEIYKGRAKDLVIGPYILLDLVGEGGMGRVYKARHTRLGREEALKVIRKEKLANPVAVTRFQSEIRAAAQLSHPNVVVAFDSDQAEGMHFFSMEFVEGIDLTKLVRQNGPMPIPQACDAIRQAALGLQHAFEKGLVHRDIKPSNLMITPRGQVKLLDLGLAMLNEPNLAGGEKASRVTQEGFVLGTPDFLAPEQAQNPGGVDIRADIYGLGATLFYLLTGKVPYEGANATEKMLKHITEPPPSLLAVRPDYPPQLDALIQWLMAKKPEDRAQTPAQIAVALAPFCPAQTGQFAPYNPATVTYPPTGSGTVPPLQQPVAVPQQAVFPQPMASPAPVPQAVPAGPYVPAPQVPDTSAFADFDANDDPESVEEPKGKKKGKKGKDKKGKAAADGTKAVRVKNPKQRSNLPLILIGGIVGLFLFCGIFGYMAYYYGKQTFSENRALEPEFKNSVGITMKKVDKGEFMMGSPDTELERQPDEGPVGLVKINYDFYMATTEITRGQYVAVMKTTTSELPRNISFNRNMQNIAPAEGMTYDQAVEFCKQLTLKESKQSNFRHGWEYRLPTEAEWEYVARAGDSTPFAHFEEPRGVGEKLLMSKHGVCDYKNFDNDPYLEIPEKFNATRQQQPMPVFASLAEAKAVNAENFYRSPNKWGFYDMHGNVGEWCLDFHADYPEGERTNPFGPDKGTYRVVRGGSWQQAASKARSAARDAHPQNHKSSEIGFRVVFAKIPQK